MLTGRERNGVSAKFDPLVVRVLRQRLKRMSVSGIGRRAGGAYAFCVSWKPANMVIPIIAYQADAYKPISAGHEKG